MPNIVTSTHDAFFKHTLKYNRRPDLSDHLYVIFADAAKLDDRDLALIAAYIETSPAPVDRAVLQEVLENVVPNRKEKIMRWLTQESFDEGMAKGKAEGKVEGKAEGVVEGKTTMLIHLILRRFGAVSNRDLHLIADADAATLETWFLRAIDAPNVNAVFVSH